MAAFRCTCVINAEYAAYTEARQDADMDTWGKVLAAERTCAQAIGVAVADTLLKRTNRAAVEECSRIANCLPTENWAI